MLKSDIFFGKMPEWSNGPHSKCGERVTVPGVRIPLFPPLCKASHIFWRWLAFFRRVLTTSSSSAPRQYSSKLVIALALSSVAPRLALLLHPGRDACSKIGQNPFKSYFIGAALILHSYIIYIPMKISNQREGAPPRSSRVGDGAVLARYVR